jgi:hypothetical protein
MVHLTQSRNVVFPPAIFAIFADASFFPNGILFSCVRGFRAFVIPVFPLGPCLCGLGGQVKVKK